MTDYREILENLGYRLKDHGRYWRTNAIYRSGDNTTALQIYKDTGVWKDFVEDSMFLPFEILIRKTLNTSDQTIINSYLNGVVSGVETHKEKKFLKEEKTYNEECLSRLLPHYDFYTDRGISVETLKKYKCGFSTSGKMYQRTVFPIYRFDKKIHGFSGRKDGYEDNKPKWLHVGRCSDWFYPFYSIKDVEDEIFSKKEVIIVESIGDSLALFENGFKNNLVSFGLNLAPKFVSRLSTLNLDKVFVALNNDHSSEKNRGVEASIKSIFKLASVIDFQKIYFLPPHKNDFGEMNFHDFNSYKEKTKTISHKETVQEVIKIAEKIKTTNVSFLDSLKKFKKAYNFQYGSN
jgi:hypothetical protein